MVISTRCRECDWKLSSNQPTQIKCGQCGLVQFVGKPGLGDRVAGFLAPIGGDLFKRAYRKVFGKSCGCQGRQDKLNRLGRRISGCLTYFRRGA